MSARPEKRSSISWKQSQPCNSLGCEETVKKEVLPEEKSSPAQSQRSSGAAAGGSGDSFGGGGDWDIQPLLDITTGQRTNPAWIAFEPRNCSSPSRSHFWALHFVWSETDGWRVGCQEGRRTPQICALDKGRWGVRWCRRGGGGGGGGGDPGR